MFDRPAQWCDRCSRLRRTVTAGMCNACRRAECQHPTVEVVGVMKVNGTLDLHERCESCFERQRGVKHSDVADPYAVPIIRDHRGGNPACEHCGAPDTELHHYAPQALFPDADSWATGFLCRLCHGIWHRVINTARKASA